jgi:FkbM family methyltransferase
MYEPDTIKGILRFLPSAGTFIDVGANIGAIAIPIARVRRDATLLCIEADPEIHEILKVNISNNCLRRVATSACHAGANEEYVSFYRAPREKFGMGSVGPQFNASPLKVRQRPLDSILAENGIDRVDVVKMDVEGSELGVLKGAQRLLSATFPPTIVFEFCDWAEGRISGQKPGDAQEFLIARGYRLFHLGRGGSLGTELSTPLREGWAMLIAVSPWHEHVRADSRTRPSTLPGNSFT